MSSDTARVLADALALIDAPEKWCQGVSQINGAHCAGKAIAVAGGGWASCRNAEHILALAIGQIDIVSWNDQPSRTHAEVVAAFRRAIEIAEAAR